MTNVVTSCSLAGWNKYGERFLKTFIYYWPTDVHLHIVSEDALPYDFDRMGGVTFWRLQESDAWRGFRDTHVCHPWVHGDSTCPRPEGIAPRWLGNTGSNFRFDAWKFSKKVFAIEQVAKAVQGGKLLWLDADVVTFAPVPSDLADNMLPSHCALSCLQRLGYHSECGFVGYNLDNSATMPFINAFTHLYSSGEVFALAEWHDSWVFDWLRNKLVMKTYAIPHRSSGHPFVNSALGKYMDHLKGKRKDKGRTPKHEQVAHKNINHWRE